MNVNIPEKLLYLGAGFGVGVAIGALFAPAAGHETRQEISGRVSDLTHKVQDKIQSSGIREAATQTWHGAVEKGRKVASIGRQRINESVESGKRRFNESMEDREAAEG